MKASESSDSIKVKFRLVATFGINGDKTSIRIYNSIKYKKYN